MFAPKDIVAELRNAPFQPFRIHLSDGRAFDVLHPDQAMVSRAHVVLGIPAEAAGDGGVFETTTKISILHITELRPIQPSRRRQ
jgi:hypothetical protein